MKKIFLRLLPLTGFFLVACNSSNQTQAPENGPTEEHRNYTSEFFQDNDYDSYTEYEETYEDGNNETSDNDVAGFDFLTKLFYYGKDVEESEKEELNDLADKFIKEEFQRSQYLITNNSAGYFRINGIVSEINNKYYQLGYHVGGINMVDAATVAGSFLDENYGVDEKIEGCMMPYPDENAIIAFENKYYRPDEDSNPSDEELKRIRTSTISSVKTQTLGIIKTLLTLSSYVPNYSRRKKALASVLHSKNLKRLMEICFCTLVG